MPAPSRHGRERAKGLQPGHVDPEGKVAVADLQRRGGGADIAARIELLNYCSPVDSTPSCGGIRNAESKYACADNGDMHCRVISIDALIP